MLRWIWIASALSSFEVLDQEMSPEVKKETGLHKLSQQEKVALQRWIDACYLKREEVASVFLGEAKRPTLSENRFQGRVLVLSDGSTWEVAPKDRGLAASWITPVPMTITQSVDSEYPYKIINQQSGSFITARDSNLAEK
jgi:hypothetical protein